MGRAILDEVRQAPIIALIVLVPVVVVLERTSPDSHTPLFLLSVLAIIPLAALLSRATEAVAAKTGDAVGGLLNPTLGNLTELVISLAALRAGQYLLVKASMAGSVQAAAGASRADASFRWFHRRSPGGGRRGDDHRVFCSPCKSPGSQRRDLTGQCRPNCSLCCTGTGARQLFRRSRTDDAPVLAGGGYHDDRRHDAAALLSNGGRGAWYPGVMALALYAIFAFTLFILPPSDPS